jgi:hypothetical protein
MSISRHQTIEKLENYRVITSNHVLRRVGIEQEAKMIEEMNSDPFNFQIRFYGCYGKGKKELHEVVRRILTNYVAAQTSMKSTL